MPRVVVFDQTGGPEVLQVISEPVPQPGAGEMRIRIEAIGLNRLDQMMRVGVYPRPFQLPHARLGCEATGVVDAIGAGVDSVAVGEAVIVTAVPEMDRNGTYADYTVVPANTVISRPAGLDVTGAAALWVAYSTAYGALIEKAGMRAGDHVLITAASSAVGLAAIQVANQIGAIPLAVTRTAAKREALLAAGATAVFVSDEGSVAEAARAFTGGAGVDLILDSVMGPGLLELATAAKFNGSLILVGWLDPRPAPMPTNAPLTIYRYMSFEHILDPVVVRRIAAFLTAGVRTGALSPVIDTVFSLDDIVQAHEHLEQGSQIGKIVITV